MVCSTEGATCDRGLCACPEQAPVLDGDKNRCLKAARINDTCEINGQCQHLMELASCKEGRCVCDYEMVMDQDKNGTAFCKAPGTRGLGEECTTNDDCGVMGGECSKGQCLCHPDLKASDKDGNCGKEAGIGELCRFPEQCTVADTTCQNQRCKCNEGLVPYPDSEGKIKCQKRGTLKYGDLCTDTLQCGYDNAKCAQDSKKTICKCDEDFPATDFIEKCGRLRSINESCTFNEQCDQETQMTECNGQICTCRFGMVGVRVGENGKYECGAPNQEPKSEETVNPAMIGVLVGMGLMFIILCVVLRLFSKARWRENRTIFNTPNPRLMNVSLLRDSKLLHSGERRGSRASVRAPSRQPSMASLRPQSPSQSLGSRAGSRRGSRASSNASGTSTKSPKSPTRPEPNNTTAPVIENVTVEVDPKA